MEDEKVVNTEEEIIEEKEVEEVEDVKPAKKTKAKAKTFSEDDLKSAVEKAKQELIAQQEHEAKLAKMSEVERKKALEAEYQAQLNKKEKELTTKEVLLNINDVLREEGLDASIKDILHIEKYVTSEDKAQAIKEDVVKLKTLIDAESNKKVEQFKRDYLKGNSPTQTTITNVSKPKSALDLIAEKYKR